MRRFYQVGCATVLAFVFGGATAFAQVAGAPAGAGAGGGMQDNSSALDELSSRPRESIPKPPTGPSRMSTFNRVTTTRKQVVPVPPQAAGASRGGTSSPATARPFTPKPGNDRANAAKSAIPAESTWRQTKRPAPPPATATKSVTRSYYPGMRPGAHPNADVAQTRARNGRGSMQGGMGMGMGMGMGTLGGAHARGAARPGVTGAPPRAPAGAMPRR
jgi:hypothetical protein